LSIASFNADFAYEMLAEGDDDAMRDCLYGEDLKPNLSGRWKAERVDFIA